MEGSHMTQAAHPFEVSVTNKVTAHFISPVKAEIFLWRHHRDRMPGGGSLGFVLEREPRLDTACVKVKPSLSTPPLHLCALKVVVAV